MMGVLHSRPVMFQSLQAAVDWAVRSGVCKNREMAGVSLVAQLVRVSLSGRKRSYYALHSTIAHHTLYY